MDNATESMGRRWWSWTLMALAALVMLGTLKELPAIRRYLKMKTM